MNAILRRNKLSKSKLNRENLNYRFLLNQAELREGLKSDQSEVGRAQKLENCPQGSPPTRSWSKSHSSPKGRDHLWTWTLTTAPCFLQVSKFPQQVLCEQIRYRPGKACYSRMMKVHFKDPSFKPFHLPVGLTFDNLFRSKLNWPTYKIHSSATCRNFSLRDQSNNQRVGHLPYTHKPWLDPNIALPTLSEVIPEHRTRIKS